MKHTLSHYLRPEQGFAQWIIILILMMGIGVGVWVAQVRTNFTPQANVAAPKIQTGLMSLKSIEPVQRNKPFTIAVEVRSDLDPVRLVTTHLKYDPAALELVSINTPPAATGSAVKYATASAAPQLTPVVSQWLETLFDNKTGNAAITGLFGNGDLKTEINKPSFQFVTLTFKAKGTLPTVLSIQDSSLLLRAADNANILANREDLEIIEATAGAVTD